MKVIIMRGLPGSGKSTFVKGLSGKVLVCSADDYHMVEGVYTFNPANIGKAHEACLIKFLDAVEGGDGGGSDIVVVDNTNLMAWEISPYYALALAHGLDVRIIRLHCDFETCCKRNVHGVPRDRVWQMYQNLLSERLPPQWREEIIGLFEF